MSTSWGSPPITNGYPHSVGANWTTTMTSYVHTVPLTTDPYLSGSGPAECSSSTALSVVPAYIFDVNGYYRELGVAPTATRAELRLAYHEKDGQSSERLTYILKQLLNPQVRHDYDRLTLGQRLVDKYVEEALLRKAKMEAARRMQERRDAGLVVNEGVERETLNRLFADMGMRVEYGDEEVGDTPDEAVDGRPIPDNDDPVTTPAKEIPFSYSFYLWRCRLSGQHQIDALARWQELLVSALSKRGVHGKFSVGLFGGMASPMALARVGFREVFFLNHLETPSPALAERAVNEWLQDRGHASSAENVR